MICINIKKIHVNTVSGNSSGVFVGNNFLPNSDAFTKSNTAVSGNNVSDSINFVIDNDGIDFGVIDKDEACQVNISKTGKNDASFNTVTNNGDFPSNNGSSSSTSSSSNGLSNSGSNSSNSSGSSSSNGSLFSDGPSNSSGSSSNGFSNSGSSSSNGSSKNVSIKNTKSSNGSSSSNPNISKNGYTKEVSINYHSLFSRPDNTNS